MPTFYGSSVADASVTTACDMATVLGGAETFKTTIFNAVQNQWGEVWSQGNASETGVTSIPGTPTGHGWVVQPGAVTIIAGVWSANIALSFTPGQPNTIANMTVRFFKRSSGGTYTSIGTIALTNPTVSTNIRTVYAFPPTSFSSVSFLASDYLYVDFWLQDTEATGIAGDEITVYESITALAGVANGVQVVTPTAGSGAAGFNASLITFASGQQILASQVNQNFQALNQANIFTPSSNAWQLNSDGGKLTSDNNGNLLCGGGKLGVSNTGDRLDAGTTPGTLYINGVQGIAIQNQNVTGANVTSTGISTGPGVGTGLSFNTGTLNATNSITGASTGTYNHGMKSISFAYPIEAINGFQAMGYDTITTNTIHITSQSGQAFICWLTFNS